MKASPPEVANSAALTKRSKGAVVAQRAYAFKKREPLCEVGLVVLQVR